MDDSRLKEEGKDLLLLPRRSWEILSLNSPSLPALKFLVRNKLTVLAEGGAEVNSLSSVITT